jgi:hypothetical protein
MSGRARCDEILRLIDDALADSVADRSAAVPSRGRGTDAGSDRAT